MQIVINLPDIVWEKAKEYGHLDICGIELSEKVMNGTPLPKKHGRLIDKAEIVISQLRADRDRLQNIIEQIRAEIEQLRLHKAQFLTNDNKVCIDSQAVLDILDKYKAESEDK